MKQFKAFHTPGKDTTMRKILLSIIALTIFSTSYSAFANVTVIEGSYIVTFKEEAGVVLPASAAKGKVPFGQHGTGQSKKDLAVMLGTTGEVAFILETINAVVMKMDAKEADRLSRDKRVLRVTQNIAGTLPATQTAPGWGLDRLDSRTPALNDAYNYVNTGAGRTIYLLDSGLALSNPTVAAEFGGRASIIWDINNGVPYGDDCNGHGTEVASIAGGNTFGVAKGVALIEAKVTIGCTNTVDVANGIIPALNWLANPANGAKGSIVIPEVQLMVELNNCVVINYPDLDTAVAKAHDAGVIVVMPAGNDNCNVANYSPVKIPQAFVVGATNTQGLPVGQDRKASFSRVGWNISAFAPGDDYARAMNQYGWTIGVSGTSFSAPYIAGIFAVACQAAGTFCNSGDTAGIYTALRNTGTLGTVTNTDGTPLTGSTSRFIWQQW